MFWSELKKSLLWTNQDCKKLIFHQAIARAYRGVWAIVRLSDLKNELLEYIQYLADFNPFEFNLFPN